MLMGIKYVLLLQISYYRYFIEHLIMFTYTVLLFN